LGILYLFQLNDSIKTKTKKGFNIMKTLKTILALALILLSVNIFSQGAVWQTIQGGLPLYHSFNDIEKVNQNELVSTGYNGLYKSNNRGNNWSQVYTHTSYNYNRVSMFGNYGLATSDHMDYTVRTTDGGNSWFTASTNYFNRSFECRDLQLVSENIAYRITWSQYNMYYSYSLEKSLDGGYNWSNVLNFFNTNLLQGLYFASENIGYVCFSGKVNKTTNGGANWTALGNGQFSKIEVVNSTIFAIKDGALSKSTDDGMTWNTLLNETIRNFDAQNTNFLITVSNSGAIRRTTNGGVTWISDITNSSANLLSVAIIDNSSAVAGGDEGTILKYENLTAITGTGIEIPSGYSLSQNYPNPFNPSTKISFSIPKSSFVKMAVYDVTGKEVEILVNENMNAGSFEVDFNASKLTSGVYFYRISAEDFAETRKMILTK
jgi:photosystem II stability/assembly factor-like uncharacterized protein